MQIHTHAHSIPIINNAVVTIGTFDGVHLGHLQVLDILKKEANEIDGSTVVITFDPHPRNFLFPTEPPVSILHTLNEKIEIFSQMGIHHLIVLPFNAFFAELSAEEFLEKYLLEKINMKKIIVGYDHTFGKNKRGDVNFLNTHSNNRYEVIQVPPQVINEITVSSTKIREALLLDFKTDVKNLLGRNYQLDGKIIHGNKIGRTLGTPTANIAISHNHKLIPSHGVYIVEIDNASFDLEKKCYGICNIGLRPTLEGKKLQVEVHIFNFDKDIYKEWMQFSLIEKLRNEVKFQDLEALQNQINLDKKQAQEKILSYNNLKNTLDTIPI